MSDKTNDNIKLAHQRCSTWVPSYHRNCFSKGSLHHRRAHTTHLIHPEPIGFCSKGTAWMQSSWPNRSKQHLQRRCSPPVSCPAKAGSKTCKICQTKLSSPQEKNRKRAWGNDMQLWDTIGPQIYVQHCPTILAAGKTERCADFLASKGPHTQARFWDLVGHPYPRLWFTESSSYSFKVRIALIWAVKTWKIGTYMTCLSSKHRYNNRKPLFWDIQKVSEVTPSIPFRLVHTPAAPACPSPEPSDIDAERRKLNPNFSLHQAWLLGELHFCTGM